MAKHKIIPIFVPHKGCPHRCSFCNQSHITGQQTEVTGDDVRQTAERYLSTIDSNKNHVEIAFYGGSFTAIDSKLQQQLLSAAQTYQKRGLVHGIRVSTRPDAITTQSLELLQTHGVTVVELGVQSMDDGVLKANERGHTAVDVLHAVRLIRTTSLSLGLQMMTGLPGDTDETALETARKIASLKPDFVRVYPALVLEHTALATKYQAGEYQPPTLEQAVRLCRSILDVFNQHSIKVIRMGLLLSDEEAKSHLIAGPYHPRFGELVKQLGVNG